MAAAYAGITEPGMDAAERAGSELSRGLSLNPDTPTLQLGYSPQTDRGTIGASSPISAYISAWEAGPARALGGLLFPPPQDERAS